ncbi:hypothetical protein SALBM311S_05599 [Streptomyces alboniger]
MAVGCGHGRCCTPQLLCLIVIGCLDGRPVREPYDRKLVAPYGVRLEDQFRVLTEFLKRGGMHDRYRATVVALGAVALSFTLGTLPGTAYAAGKVHGSRPGETTPSRVGYWPLEAAPGGVASNVEPEGLPLLLNGDAWIYHNEDIWGDPALVDQGDLRLDGDGDWAATSAVPVGEDGSFTLAARARLAAADNKTQTVLSLPGSDADRLAIRYRPGCALGTCT